ncbi:MAG: primosomal protein N' [bacterium]
MWVHIVFPHPPYQKFTYKVPEKFISEVNKGQRVLVRLGNRLVSGFIEDFSTKPDLKKIREIIDILDPDPLLTGDILKLTQWISSYYLAPLGMAIKTALPPGIFKKNKINIQYEQILHLARDINSEEIFRLKKKAPAQARVLETLLLHKKGVKRKQIKEKKTVLTRLEEKGLIKVQKSELIRDPYSNFKITPPESVKLTSQQAAALKTIKNEIDKNHFHPILLYGITSSGKTQIYIEAIKNIFEKGGTALVLIPEISLTPQAVQRYKSFFGDQVAVLHSRMSAGERFDTWRKIKDGTYKIAIGPRSALFAPLNNLGIIIVDEEHDSSYKQINPAPRYHARDAAIVRAKINNCVIVLGSATPSLESYQNTLNGKYTLCTLTRRIDDLPLPKVTLIDHKKSVMKKETRVFCTDMKDSIQQRLQNGDQIILLQNRRGYSTFLRCSNCGNIDSCPNCDVSLTYHQKNHILMCHICGFQKKAQKACSCCGGTNISYRGIGTQRVEEELKKLFPESKVIRMDQDTTRGKGTHDKIITDFEKKKNDILLGTQMIAKGHDFPGVNLVGIISADTGLYFPDFRSSEKTFQLLTQAAGRAGRKGMPGEVIIQTMNPENPILQFAIEHDYQKFFHYETRQRRELQYPPWGRIIIVRFRSRNNTDTAKAAHLFCKNISKNKLVLSLGPAICPISRIKNYYRYQIMFRSSKARDPSGRILRKVVRETMIRYQEKRKFFNVKVSLDVDPVDVM